jgi:hypothetical protein
MERTHLPKCDRHSGLGTKLNTCVGCEGYITPGDHSHFCLFREIWYELDGTLSHLVKINTTQSACGRENLQDKAIEGHIGTPIPPSND